jgi:hypothetical protein
MTTNEAGYTAADLLRYATYVEDFTKGRTVEDGMRTVSAELCEPSTMRITGHGWIIEWFGVGTVGQTLEDCMRALPQAMRMAALELHEPDASADAGRIYCETFDDAIAGGCDQYEADKHAARAERKHYEERIAVMAAALVEAC